MEQQLIFRLDNATPKKWQKYKSLIGEIDNIDIKEGIITLQRSYNDKNYTLQVRTKSGDRTSFFTCSNKISNLLARHGLSVSCIFAKEYEAPDQINIKMYLQLKKQFHTHYYFKMWEKIARVIDLESRVRNIVVKRIKHPAHFSMTIHVSIINYFDWSYIGFFAGHICGKAGLEFEVSEPILDLRTEDILDEMINISNETRQLSFDDFLVNQIGEKRNERFKKSKII